MNAKQKTGCLLVVLSLIVGCGGPPAEQDASDTLAVAVLPFQVEGQAEGVEFVGRAVADSVAAALAQAETLELLDVARSGDAARLVQGTLTREGDAVTARAQLLDAASGDVLWEDELTSGGGDLSDLASRLAVKLMQSMKAEASDLYAYIGNVAGGPEMAESPVHARARDAWERGDNVELLEVSSELVEAFPEDPAAHVLNAWALLLAWDADPSSEALLARLKDRLVTLTSVDSSSPYDELMRAYVYRSSGQPEQASDLYSRVLGRKDLSNTARAWILRQRCFTLRQLGNAAVAREDASEAIRLDPSSARSHVALSRALESTGQLEEAIEASNHALLLQPSGWRHHQRLGIVLARAGRFDESVASLEHACRLGSAQEACANLAVTLQRAGRDAEALVAADSAEELVGSRWGFYNLACYRALAGNHPGAITDLRRALELGYADVLINTDPDLESLRGDAEFESILSEAADRLRTRRQLSSSVFPWQS